MSSVIQVCLGKNSYDIAIASGSLNQLGSYLKPLKLGKKVLLVSNKEIFDHYGEMAISSLQEAGFDTYTHEIPEGEVHKTLDSIARLYDTASENRLERSSTMVALGGGVVGDMTGFAAATWKRGINFVQVPTSLLAMVDASIGGKTGVNHPSGKNFIGAFYQPRLVLIDPQVLKTLPDREFRAGMAEVIKYGVILDANLFAKLEREERLDNFACLSEELLQLILTQSCQAKANVVSEDEKEDGLRAILNYGHTIGHAIESLTGYSVINHGEAVAMGMVAAGRIATKLKMWTQEEELRQFKLIQKVGLPVQIPANLDTEAAIKLLPTDKKAKNGQVPFILPTEIGKVTIIDSVPSDIIREAIDETKAT